jgi:hypothetical protein
MAKSMTRREGQREGIPISAVRGFTLFEWVDYEIRDGREGKRVQPNE